MKVLVVGNGGREHAIAWKLAESKDVKEVVCVPGNGGTAYEDKCVNIAPEGGNYVEIARREGCSLAVIGPENPLADGLADEFWAAGIPVVGPKKAAAQLEASKGLAKDFMKKYKVAAAASETFTDKDKALEYIRQKGAPIVVKADGLAAGKGVVVAKTVEEAQAAVHEMMEDKKFGESGATLVIEDYLTGNEVSILAAVSVTPELAAAGKACIIPFLSARDHKRLRDGAKGPNTGGMGAYSPVPIVTDDELAVMERVMADETFRNIPVIVLTAEKNAELQALEMGAADFITKPFDVPEIILARVGRIIELSEGRQLISAAETDRVTGLYTRNFFFEYARRIFHDFPEVHMDAVVLNIEQFHIINAIHGMEFGDSVLRAIGEEICQVLSTTEGIASRLEADRFVIYCVCQPDYGALLNRFQNRVNMISPNVSLHLRMGVKPYMPDVEPVLMFDRAWTACNMVRGNYQTPLMIYEEEMRKRELLNQRLLNDLQTAVRERQLKVFYQPQYDIQCDPPRLASAEALIRWSHPELGMISPGDFVPLFESNGLISIVDDYVWCEAAEQIARWHARYGFKLPVSVNLSRTDIFDPTLVDRLARLIEDNGLDYRDLKLEVTESAYTEKANDLLDALNRLRALGFEIEMDDFGSGYSSLNMISDMPIDVLKMDMKFVRNIETSETDYWLVRLILDLARHLKLSVVAEGIETEGQLKLLKDAMCNLVQGYYFSRPLPPEAFEALIEKEQNISRT